MLTKSMVIGSFAAPAVLALAGGVASAQSLFEQPNNRAAQPSFITDGTITQGFMSRVADNFTLGTSGSATGVRFWGGSSNFSTTGISNFSGFRVAIYASDTLGVPSTATPLLDTIVPIASTNPTSTGLTIFGGGQQFAHEFTFSSPVALTGGASYWLSIGGVRINEFGDGWVWSGSTTGDLINATEFSAGGGFSVFNPTFNDLAFAIVPTPGAAGLLGVAGLAATRRRR